MREIKWFSKQLEVLALAIVIGAVITPSPLKAQLKEPTTVIGQDVSLQIASVVDQPGPTLAFTVTNHSKATIEIDGPMRDPSRLVITRPDGTEVYDSYVADDFTGFYPSVKPSESKTWKINIADSFITTRQLTRPGIYRIHWVWVQWKKEIRYIYKSNEMLLLREKETPVINPQTGRPEPK